MPESTRTGNKNVVANNDPQNIDDKGEVKASWELLVFHDRRSIKSIDFTLSSDDAEFWNRRVGRARYLKELSITIDDTDLIRDAQQSLGFANCLSTTIPFNGGGGSGGAGRAHGSVVIKTTDGQFTVWITEMGFSLDRPVANLKSRFFCAALAETLQDWHIQNSQRPLPSEIIDILSGTVEIRQQRMMHRLQLLNRSSGNATANENGK